MSGRSYNEPGGFVHTGLPSPPASLVSHGPSILPQQRATPLRSGGPKETAFRNLVDGKLRDISAKFERRYQDDDVPEGPQSAPSQPGYHNARDIAEDLEQVVDAVWVSGTLSLQIPFFLNIANALLDYVEPFPFAPGPTLRLLQKLDIAFSSLIHGEDMQTGMQLPGFESGRKVSTTEKVRIRGIVERTRVGMVRLAGQQHEEREEPYDLSTDDLETTDTDTGYSDAVNQNKESQADMDLDLDVARVYQRTLAELNDTLDGSF